MSSPLSTELVSLGQDILLAPPPASVGEDSPKIIILFGWMDAQLSHLHKYIALHHELFPSTPVLLIRSRSTDFFKSQSSRLTGLQPALRLLPASDILFHVISNGGCLRFTDLLALRDIPSNSQCPILFDSGPGVQELETSLLAFLAPFKNPVARLIGRLILVPIYFVTKLTDRLLRGGGALERMRELLNDLDKIGPGSSRAYVYSKEDPFVQYWAVEAHAEAAHGKGYQVALHEFHGSSHAAHLRKAPERYRKVIQELWKTGVDQ